MGGKGKMRGVVPRRNGIDDQGSASIGCSSNSGFV